jgi:Ca2+-binding EF-hand superfamily protein
LQSNDTDENIKRDLEKLGQQKWIQTSKAERAFALLDEGQKEFVVVQDLQRVATDLLQDATVDDLHEMVQEFDQSGDGILTKDDLIRIARKVGL